MNGANFQEEFKLLQEKYPELTIVVQTSNGWRIEGKMPIVDRNGYCWDIYDINIVIFNDYPQSLPLLVEVGGKIKRDHDWHINKDGICCVGTTAKQFRELSDGNTLLKWVERFAKPYLANHVLRKEKGSYANGEYSHGIKGVIEYYQELFNIENPSLIIKRLKLMLGRQSLNRNELCFCGSNKKYKRCFGLNADQHRLGIPEKILVEDLSNICKNSLVA